MRKILEIDLHSSSPCLGEVRTFLGALGRVLRMDDEANYAVVNSVDEIYANILEHAYRDRGGRVKIRLYSGPRQVKVVVKDWGRTYDHFRRKPDPAAMVEAGRTRGLGLSMVQRLMDEAHYVRRKHGNEHVLVKHYQPKEAPC